MPTQKKKVKSADDEAALVAAGQQPSPMPTEGGKITIWFVLCAFGSTLQTT